MIFILINCVIHGGAIGGLAGKILAFFISLVIAKLPVTGFCIWYGRRYKNLEKVPRAGRELVKTLS